MLARHKRINLSLCRQQDPTVVPRKSITILPLTCKGKLEISASLGHLENLLKIFFSPGYLKVKDC